MVNGRQLYKCHACGKQFLGGERRDPEALFTSYLEGKQTYGQLAERHGCSTRTIHRCLDKAKPARLERFSSVANVVMDTTYFGLVRVAAGRRRLRGIRLRLERHRRRHR